VIILLTSLIWLVICLCAASFAYVMGFYNGALDQLRRTQKEVQKFLAQENPPPREEKPTVH